MGSEKDSHQYSLNYTVWISSLNYKLKDQDMHY